jgi:hypothetical protein
LVFKLCRFPYILLRDIRAQSVQSIFKISWFVAPPFSVSWRFLVALSSPAWAKVCLYWIHLLAPFAPLQEIIFSVVKTLFLVWLRLYRAIAPSPALTLPSPALTLPYLAA